MKFGLKMFALCFRVNKSVKYGFFLNGMFLWKMMTVINSEFFKYFKVWRFWLPVNYAAESWIGLTRPFWDEFLHKFQVFGTHSEKWKPILLKYVDASQLPPKYGGTNNWKPLEFQE